MIELAFAAFMHGKLMGITTYPGTFPYHAKCVSAMDKILERKAKRGFNIKGVCRPKLTRPT